MVNVNQLIDDEQGAVVPGREAINICHQLIGMGYVADDDVEYFEDDELVFECFRKGKNEVWFQELEDGRYLVEAY